MVDHAVVSGLFAAIVFGDKMPDKWTREESELVSDHIKECTECRQMYDEAERLGTIAGKFNPAILIEIK